MTSPTESMLIEKFTGQLVYLYSRRMMAYYPGLRDSVELRQSLDQNVQALILQITAQCVSGRIPTREETVIVNWPDGVWQTFKNKFMPAWFIKRFPVRMASQTVVSSTHTYFVCPHKELPSNDPKHIQFMATGTPLAERMSRP